MKEIKQKETIDILANIEIPDHFLFSGYGFTNFIKREQYISEFGFVYVCWDWINELVKWIGDRKCLEVMAGRGTLSNALQRKGINVITTDDYSWANEIHELWKQPYVSIEDIDAIEAVEKYGKDIDIIIISWPYMDDTAYRVLQKMREVNKNAVMIYIGEGYGGCTANDTFFDSIEKIEDESFNNINKIFPSWTAIHDRLFLIK